MRRYRITVTKLKSVCFEVEAKNKKKAQEMVEDIFYKTDIFEIDNNYTFNRYNYQIDRLKKGRKNAKNK